MRNFMFETYNPKTGLYTGFLIDTDDYTKLMKRKEVTLKVRIHTTPYGDESHYFSNDDTIIVNYYGGDVNVKSVNIDHSEGSTTGRENHNLQEELNKAFKETFFVTGLRKIKRVARMADINPQIITEVKNVTVPFINNNFVDMEHLLEDKDKFLVVTNTGIIHSSPIGKTADYEGRQTLTVQPYSDEKTFWIMSKKYKLARIKADWYGHHSDHMYDWLTFSDNEEEVPEGKEKSFTGLKIGSNSEAYIISTKASDVRQVAESYLIKYGFDSLLYLDPKVKEALKFLKENLSVEAKK